MDPEEIRYQMNVTRADMDRKLHLLERRARPAVRRAIGWVAAVCATIAGTVIWRKRARRRSFIPM